MTAVMTRMSALTAVATLVSYPIGWVMAPPKVAVASSMLSAGALFFLI